jgi:hypothetical protein
MLIRDDFTPNEDPLAFWRGLMFAFASQAFFWAFIFWVAYS